MPEEREPPQPAAWVPPPPGPGSPAGPPPVPPWYGQVPAPWPPPAFGGPPRPAQWHQLWAVLTTVLCCPPLGIVALVHTARASSRRSAGDVTGAAAAARSARRWAIGAAVGGLAWLVLLVMLGPGGVAGQGG